MIRASFVATTRSVSRCAGSVMERMTVGTCLMRRIVVSTAASVCQQQLLVIGTASIY